VFASLETAGEIPDMVIGADTVVERDGIILEKPEDKLDAASTLRSLRGKPHQVHTGVAIIASSAKECSFSETTVVSFMDFSDQDIDEYIASGEPFGKAGSYGIQGKAAVFVKGIEGCYFNVVGFPLHRFLKELDMFMMSSTA
jgi:septum formation protein